MSENDNIEVFEAGSAEVTDDGDIIAEDIVAAVDTETGEAVIDDLVVEEDADGNGFIEETITAIDAEGNATVLADEVVEFTDEEAD
ncbi:MAG: hypothetical protein MUF33_07480 [Candidatus Nanopelagicales bacterium]|jgi:hypothetical protein|nr:hypothetical protein [Candidatus Nanopelagicales bacterium]MCU0298348.1 hypothetical protein [Candidatus Nanopelagicales bacterium]